MSRLRSAAFLVALPCAAHVGFAQETPLPSNAAPPTAPVPTVAPDHTAPLPPAASQADAPAEQPAFESEIRQADAAYVAAFNAKDAAALAAQWSPDAVYVDRSTGEETVGREAIAAEYATLFEASPELKLDIEADSIELISPGVAVEHGTAKFISPDADPERIDFISVWVRRDDKWLLDRVSDEATVDPSPHYEHLRELEWMIGEWVDQDDQATVETECRWTRNKNFILREFAVAVGDQIDISGVQVIGWNAETKRLQSWTFDSDGGFAEGTWTAADGGRRWYVRNRGYTSDGARVATTNVIRTIDDDSFGWQTIDQAVDGEILPNIDETLVVRRR
jgi:uncharacterized protein (TIGR02246 family)